MGCVFIVRTEAGPDGGLLVVVAFWVAADARLLKKGGRVASVGARC